MENNNSKYSKLSFQIFLISLSLTFASILSSFLRVKGSLGNNQMETIMLIITILLFITILNGVIFVIKSITKKEPNSAYKIIGMVGNTFYFMVFLGFISFIINDLLMAFG